jgi:hypothetical protein
MAPSVGFHTRFEAVNAHAKHRARGCDARWRAGRCEKVAAAAPAAWRCSPRCAEPRRIGNNHAVDDGQQCVRIDDVAQIGAQQKPAAQCVGVTDAIGGVGGDSVGKIGAKDIRVPRRLFSFSSADAFCRQKSDVMEVRAFQPKMDAHEDNLHVCCRSVGAGDGFSRVSRIDENLSVSVHLYVRHAMGI